MKSKIRNRKKNIEKGGLKMGKNKKSPEYDSIEIGCSGWRWWERLGGEILDWKGVLGRSGYASANFDKSNTYFFIDITVLRSNSEQVFKRLKAYPGVVKARWGRWNGNHIYMGTYGYWR